MTTSSVSVSSMRRERRYRAYEKAMSRDTERRHFRHGLKVAFFGTLLGVIVGLLVAAWQFPILP